MDLGALSGAGVVDPSATLSERLPETWPGHMSYAHRNWNWFAEVDGPTGKTLSAAPYQTNFVLIDEHCGTLFDAPTHFIPPEGSGLPYASPLGAETGDKVAVGDLMGPAVVVDVRFLAEGGEPGVSPFITADHVRAWEEENGEISAGEVALRSRSAAPQEAPEGLSPSCRRGEAVGLPQVPRYYPRGVRRREAK